MKDQKIGIFYGSDTGYTEGVAKAIADIIGEDNVDLIDAYKLDQHSFEPYNKIIIGLSTWNDGQLQSDWDAYYEQFKSIDFSDKVVALFGLGDQVGYCEYFIDGVGILADVVYENGGQIVGLWPTEGYEYEVSKAEYEKEWFIGLAIDEDNQPELTMGRVEVWCAQVLSEFDELLTEPLLN